MGKDRLLVKLKKLALVIIGALTINMVGSEAVGCVDTTSEYESEYDSFSSTTVNTATTSDAQEVPPLAPDEPWEDTHLPAVPAMLSAPVWHMEWDKFVSDICYDQGRPMLPELPLDIIHSETIRWKGDEIRVFVACQALGQAFGGKSIIVIQGYPVNPRDPGIGVLSIPPGSSDVNISEVVSKWPVSSHPSRRVFDGLRGYMVATGRTRSRPIVLEGQWNQLQLCVTSAGARQESPCAVQLKVSQAPVSINLRDTQGGKPGSNVLAQVRGYVFGNSAGFQISIQLGIDNHWLPKDIPVKPGGHIVFGRDARDASLLGIPTDDFTKFGRTVKGAWPTKRCGYLEAPLLPFGVRSDLSIPISWS